MRIAVAGHDIAGMTLALRLRIKGHDVFVHPTGTSFPLSEEFTVIAPMRDLFLKSGGALDDELAFVEVQEPLHCMIDGLAVELPAVGTQVPAITAALGSDAGKQWGMLLQLAAEVWQQVRTDAYRPSSSLGVRLRRTLRDQRLRTLFVATLPGVPPSQLGDTAIVFPYLQQTFGRWRFDGGMAAFSEVLRTRCDTVGVQFIDVPAAAAMTVQSHYQPMFGRPRRFARRDIPELTTRLGLPFIGMAAESVANRIGRA